MGLAKEWPGPTAAKAFISRVPVRRVRMVLDRYRGLDFLSTIRPEEVGLDPARVRKSTPSGNRYLKNVFHRLSIQPYDSILDIGCGKGSAMRTMLQFPFARIDGLELSEQIAAIATRNFRKLGAPRCRVFVGDASRFTDYDAYNFFYIYNPFPTHVMARVIQAIERSLENSAKEITLIYNNPVCHDTVIQSGFFSRTQVHPSEWGSGISLYSNRQTPQSGSTTYSTTPLQNLTPANDGPQTYAKTSWH